MTKMIAISTLALMSLGLSATASLAGDAAAGEAAWRGCRSCHSITAPDGTQIQRGGRTGPNLYGIAGRQIASAEGFRYSEILAEYGATGAVWTAELFAEYVADPTAFVRAHTGDNSARSPMSFRLRSGADDMWAYLESVAPAQ